jgi:hypothetical protein
MTVELANTGSTAETRTEGKSGGLQPETVTSAINRGVSVEWLVEWTTRRGLWRTPTYEVVTSLIIPLTKAQGCRFVDVAGEGLRESGGVGRAHAFISHAWASDWGDLVAAAQQFSQPGRRVWIDILAVNQHQPATDLELLKSVIASMPEGIVVVIDPARQDDAGKNPFRRAWCVWEAFNALQANVPMLIKMGRKVLIEPAVLSTVQGLDVLDNPANDDGLRWTFETEWNLGSVQQLADSISLAEVTASRQVDLQTIMTHIHAHVAPFTVEETIRHVVWAGWTSRTLPALSYAVQGVDALRAAGLDLDAANPEGWTALHCAASSGLVGAVGVLLDLGASINATSSKGRTALLNAAWSGQPGTVKQLLAAGADLTLQDTHGNTAAYYAAKKQPRICDRRWHECARLLGRAATHGCSTVPQIGLQCDQRVAAGGREAAEKRRRIASSGSSTGCSTTYFLHDEGDASNF